ncbi:DUF1642 domain-containing protein [Streptococcus sp. 5346]|uniref:DUF1642 domain-containing protein n=1 Tax=Streptococcus sp. 5346 TaxID=2582636 RepID=UPI0015663A15|nr:DUF1642 domain-containing protein [Streptococcus sp. 5346]
MNIKALIKKYEAVECVVGIVSGKTILKTVLRDLKQLDEPQPVKVPPFVADFIAEQKKLGHTLSYSIDACMSDIVAEWYWDNSELFALAWIFGYEVEEEKRYRISMPKARNYMNHAQILCEKDGKIFWCGEWYPFRAKFTRKQLEEAGFGWVFDCEGVEVQEVEG